MRLGVLSRLGIVLSAIWLPAGTLYFVNDQVSDWDRMITSSRDFCEGLARERGERTDKCLAEWRQDFRRMPRAEFWQGSFGIALLLTVVAWILLGGAYWAGRWILAGRRPSEPGADNPRSQSP